MAAVRRRGHDQETQKNETKGSVRRDHWRGRSSEKKDLVNDGHHVHGGIKYTRERTRDYLKIQGSL